MSKELEQQTWLVGFDIESTGVDPEVCQPVQIAASCFKQGWSSGDPLIVFNSFSNPTCKIEDEAVDVHGITKEHVKYAPNPKMVVSSLYNFVSSIGCDHLIYLVGYNSEAFDLPVMTRYQQGFYNFQHIDVFKLVLRELYEYGLKLTEVYENYVGKQPDDAHDAAVDTLLVLEVLIKYMKDTNKSADQILVELETPRIYGVFPFGKHKGKPISKVPKGYATWCLNNFTNMTPDTVMTLKHISENGKKGGER